MSSSEQSARILIVGDEPHVAADIAHKLQQEGYQVVASCASGSEALTLAGQFHPDLVLMDIMLPGVMDGIETTRHLRSRFAFPVIYLTAYADAALLARAQITEPFGYILKPCGARELQLVIAMALRDGEQSYRTLVEAMSDGLVRLDARNRVTYVNAHVCAMLGYDAAELLGHELTEFLDESAACMFRERPVQNGLGAQGTQDVELVSKNGCRIPVHISATSLTDVKGDYTGSIAVLTDMTARIEAEQQRMQHAQRQRDVLIREVHHRIKNNLQGVTGLLRQHSAEHPELRAVIERVIVQIGSMAVVFGLQSGERSDDLRLCEMLTAICAMAGEVMHPRHAPVVAIEAPVPVCVDKLEAVPIALVLNELICNAIKHDATAGTSAGVSVALSSAGNTARVLISNRGVHLPAAFDFAAGRGMGTGLLLVKSLLPHDGACLNISRTEDGVSAELLLRPPVILPPGDARCIRR